MLFHVLTFEGHDTRQQSCLIDTCSEGWMPSITIIIVESTGPWCPKSDVRPLSLFKLITFANQCVVTLLVSKRFWRDREQEVAFAHDVWGRHPVEILLNASEDSNVQDYKTAAGHAAINCDLQRP